jgi:hypothetical protein
MAKKRDHRIKDTPKAKEQVWCKGIFPEASARQDFTEDLDELNPAMPANQCVKTHKF